MSVRSILAIAAISIAAPIYGATLSSDRTANWSSTANLNGAQETAGSLNETVPGNGAEPFDFSGLSTASGSTGGDVVDAPEPGAIPIVAAGILILALMSRRRRSR